MAIEWRESSETTRHDSVKWPKGLLFRAVAKIFRIGADTRSFETLPRPKKTFFFYFLLFLAGIVVGMITSIEKNRGKGQFRVICSREAVRDDALFLRRVSVSM